LQMNGILVNAPRSTTIRIAPPLNVTAAQVAHFCRTFIATLKESDYVAS